MSIYHQEKKYLKKEKKKSEFNNQTIDSSGIFASAQEGMIFGARNKISN